MTHAFGVEKEKKLTFYVYETTSPHGDFACDDISLDGLLQQANWHIRIYIQHSSWASPETRDKLSRVSGKNC